MRTKLITHFLSLFLFVSSISFANPKITNDQDPEKDKVLISVLNYMLTQGHYNQKVLNDDFSEMVFNNFIADLDPSKRYFTKIDIKEFSKYKYQIDNQLKESDIVFFMCSMSFLRTKYIREHEISTAKELNKIIIPIILKVTAKY